MGQKSDTKRIRIGGASGYWGDSSLSTPQLLKDGTLDYIVYDYLAEITMSIIARAKAKNPDEGYAKDFVDLVLKHNLREIARQNVKIISNAGGMNPEACAAAIRTLCTALDLDLKVAVVTGDDLTPQASDILALGYTEMFTNDDLPAPETIASMNAYLGAFPIAKALAGGADIVITGRCVDSAVTLGACIHEFGWSAEDYDALAGGSLAGHILECGPQATGGNYTDWEDVADSMDTIGYPIAEIAPDGSFITTKPADTGGTVTVGTVSEQMLYEIGDPQAYILPDVICDFSGVSVCQLAADQVEVKGAKGTAPTDTYKVCLTALDGYRGGTMMTFYGIDAAKKAEAFATATFKRARALLRRLNAADYTETSVEILGADSQFGSTPANSAAKEVVLKVAAKHPDPMGISVLIKELSGLGLATPPGLCGFVGSRPKPMPVMKLYSFLIPKNTVHIEIKAAAGTKPHADVPGSSFSPNQLCRPAPPSTAETENMVTVPLIKLAWGRSGDKGNKANVGIIARRPEYLPYIWQALTKEKVASVFAHFLENSAPESVEKFLLPGSNSMNFLMDNVLGGGGVASLRNDPQGKGYAQILLATPIPVPHDLLETL
ncbi:hypothetical protein GCM10017044_28280 [Kordiimonas sediminis]|uniref:Terpene utilization protein AtuA n=1 Tax=Kordiimonas sediminis TaxID=1735581 RepID=A0A919EAU7_9PROT|nr:acyclic terpene utilization AtuA family protein [Kordiimonas sediminis]GHF31169.1 hypothetical protein GCM10017044_28280 [Kordiimonas sediminis]